MSTIEIDRPAVDEQPALTRDQQIRLRIATQLHTIQGGEELWKVNSFNADQCIRCLNLADALIEIQKGQLVQLPLALQVDADDTEFVYPPVAGDIAVHVLSGEQRVVASVTSTAAFVYLNQHGQRIGPFRTEDFAFRRQLTDQG